MKTTITILMDLYSDDVCSSDGYDFLVIALTRDTLAELLSYCSFMETLQQQNPWVYNLECWDASPVCISQCDELFNLVDVSGLIFDDRVNGQPFWPTTDLPNGLDYQPIDCQTVQISSDEIWWSCFIKHTLMRLESSHVSKETLQLFWQHCLDDSDHPLLFESILVQPDWPSTCRGNLCRSEVCYG